MVYLLPGTTVLPLATLTLAPLSVADPPVTVTVLDCVPLMLSIHTAAVVKTRLPLTVSAPGPLRVFASVTEVPSVSIVPPALCTLTGRLIVILPPASCKVPPVKIGPGEPVGPEASVQASAPGLLALKVSPLAKSALPLLQMPGKSIGSLPTVIVVTTVLVAVLITVTVLLNVMGLLTP